MEYFISVDPVVEKTMDAYGYCYQNPINIVDPDGQEGKPVYDNIITTVSNKRGDSHYVNRTVQITMTLSVVNEKGANLSNTMFSKPSGSVTLSSLSGLAQKDFRGNDVYAQDNVIVKVQYKVVSSLKDVGKDDHVMVLSGDIPKLFGEKGSPVGRAELGGRVSAVERGTLKNGTFDEVVSHEIGHMLGLGHKEGGLMDETVLNGRTSTTAGERGNVVYEQVGPLEGNGTYKQSERGNNYKTSIKTQVSNFINRSKIQD